MFSCGYLIVISWFLSLSLAASNLQEHFVNNTRSKRFVSIPDIFGHTKKVADSVLDKVVPTAIKKFFQPNYEIKNYNEEHGNLDFFGRDVVRYITQEATRFGKKIGIIQSDTSRGLDSNKNFFSGIANNFKEHVRAIYPGTLWCGDGSIARSFDDLGIYSKTDACCRQHDECPDGIPANEEKYGLRNTGLFTRSHCDCDLKFYKCLKEANTGVSTQIGITYFTVLGPQCFKNEYPIYDCNSAKMGRCVAYELDDTLSKKYQWFDNPPF